MLAIRSFDIQQSDYSITAEVVVDASLVGISIGEIETSVSPSANSGIPYCSIIAVFSVGADAGIADAAAA